MSTIDLLVDAQAQAAGWPKPAREVRVCKDRKFRFDYAWQGVMPVGRWHEQATPKVALEVEGGLWLKKSGHNTGTGIQRDMEKQNVAVTNGWRVLRLTPQQVKNGELETWLRKMAA